MTRFIESLSTHQLLPPYRCDAASVHCFLFDIGPQAIQTYCDTFLNIGDPLQRPYEWRAIPQAPFGMLCVTHYPAIYSLDPETPRALGVQAQAWDHLKQTEMFVAAPVTRYRRTNDNLLVDPVIEWVQPILIVDNATSAFSGREILGLDWLYGHVDFMRPAKPGGFQVNVTLPSWKVFGPNSPEEMLPFASLTRGQPLPLEAGETPGAAADRLGLSAFIAQLEAAIPDLAGIAEGKFPETLELVGLKQFRAAGDPNLAIYQAVIALSCCYSNVNDMQFFDAAEAVVTFQGSSMVNEILGTFLNVPPKWRPGPVMVGSDGKMVPSQLPRVRALEPRMVFSFTAQMDLTAAGTLYTFRDLPPAAPRKPRASR